MDCETRPVFGPLKAYSERRDQVWGRQQPRGSPPGLPSRGRVKYTLCGAFGEPADWSRVARNLARAGRVARWGRRKEPPRVYTTHGTTRPRGVSGRPRPIGRLPAPPVRSVHGPTPQLTPCRRYAWWLVDAQGSTGSSRCTSERGRNGPCFTFHPSGFPCAHAGSDGCPVFTRETSPVKSCGLYTDAALRGRLVPLEEVHLAEIQA